MKKSNLPKNWVARTSTTYPDRLYYFNIITNKSSWAPPSPDPNISNDDESQKKMKKQTNKRKNPSDESCGSTPRTPELDEPPPDDRPKLKARRLFDKRENAKNPASSNDTPQMKALREKMLQRQIEGNAVKKSKIIKSPEVKTSTSRVKKKKTLHQPSASDDTSDQKGLTPQMRLVREKMKARKSLDPSVVKAKQPPVEVTDTNNEKIITRSRRTRSMTVVTDNSDSSVLIPASSDSEGQVGSKKSRSSMIEDNLKRLRTIEAPPGVPSKRILVDKDDQAEPSNISALLQSIPEVPEKNLARRRLDNLRQSLASPKKNEQVTVLRGRKKVAGKKLDPTILLKNESPPVLYKNANERMKDLRQRLSIEAELVSEKRRSTIVINSAETTDEPDSTLDTIIDATEPSYEEMEWEPIEEERIVFEIHSVRTELDICDVAMDDEVPVNPLSFDVTDSAKSSQRVLYIVIDTNVFLTSLQSVELARDAMFKHYGRPLIVIPWTVIRELDFIKDDKSNKRPESLKAKARRAIRFIHDHFSAKHPRVFGQTYHDCMQNRKKYEFDCPDDEILQTCLQIRSTQNSVVLLSYDTNLCNKAMFHDVLTLGRLDPMEKIDFLQESEHRDESLLSISLKVTGDDPQEEESPLSRELALAEDLYEETTGVLCSFMTVIVAKEMKNLFGDNWERYTIIQPPWTAMTVLQCTIKHWIAAISESFIASAELIIKDLHMLVKKLQFNRRLKDVGHLADRFFDLVQCLKSDKYPNMRTKYFVIIEKLRDKQLEATKTIEEEQLRDKVGPGGTEHEQEMKADIAFKCFERVYSFGRDVCGVAAEIMGMPCTFIYKRDESLASVDDIKSLRAEVAANINRLLQVLSTALEDIDKIDVNHRSVAALYHVLVNSLAEIGADAKEQLSPLAVYCCLKRKSNVLRLGLGQLQELSSHFCRMASFKAT